MAKFIFKLQALLDLKIQLEDAQKIELGKSIRHMELQKRIYSDMEFEKEEVIGLFNSSSGKGVQVGKLKEYSTYISVLKQRMEEQKERVNCAEENVDKNREQLLKIVQEKKILEELKSRKLEEYRKAQFKLEQRLIDEVTSYKYSRQIAGEENG